MCQQASGKQGVAIRSTNQAGRRKSVRLASAGGLPKCPESTSLYG